MTSRLTIAAILFAMLPVAQGRAAEPKGTPIQDHLRSGILAMGAGDNFGRSETSPAQTSAGEFAPKPKSGLRAVLLSALVPGGGEYYLGHRSRARFFFAGEAASWIGFISFRMYGHWQKEDMIRFARDRAGAQLEGKNNEMQDFVGFYTDIDEYNTLGRATDPERPYLFDTPDNHWRWQSIDDQVTYRTIKNSSRSAYRRANFMIGVMVVSRLVSMIDVYRIVRRSHSAESFSQAGPPKVRFEVNPFALERQVSLTLSTPF